MVFTDNNVIWDYIVLQNFTEQVETDFWICIFHDYYG